MLDITYIDQNGNRIEALVNDDSDCDWILMAISHPDQPCRSGTWEAANGAELHRFIQDRVNEFAIELAWLPMALIA